MSQVRTIAVTDARVGPALDTKHEALATIAVCIPCRNEAATIGAIVAAIDHSLVRTGFVDELIVVDDRSHDATADVARASGGTVVAVDDIHPELGRGDGKGNALWASLAASSADIVVWCDGDLRDFDPTWIVRLALPLLNDPTIALVKASYKRPTDLHGAGGGRTTELVARPLLSLFYPELTALHQPLSGESAVRRTAVEGLAIAQGWGVEVALLIDIANHYGTNSIVQVDLGTRRHRHRNLDDLATQAAEVATTIIDLAAPTTLARASKVLRTSQGATIPLNTAWRPPTG
jgi:glucosyl-3-phosphoglycerate synthase